MMCDMNAIGEKWLLLRKILKNRKKKLQIHNHNATIHCLDYMVIIKHF